ncbi:ESX-1 secretion-associated protein [Amycolatopsis sp. FDAARGOS 1241]|nr:ESX-1 secretion-associated protein [Amycolatopsis sp. FDAARGOS 1241]
MTSGSGFEVEPDELVAHASHLDGLTDRLNNAVQAADYALSDDAYGLLCAFLPPIVNPTGQQAKDTVSAAAEGMQTTADNVRTAAQGYRDRDESQAQPFLRSLSNSDDAAGLSSDGEPATLRRASVGTSAGDSSGVDPSRFRIGTTVQEPAADPSSFRIGTVTE